MAREGVLMELIEYWADKAQYHAAMRHFELWDAARRVVAELCQAAGVDADFWLRHKC